MTELVENNPAIRFENVSYIVGKKTILENITLAIQQKAITGILGQNGAGKTTLLSLGTGLHHPSQGTVHIFDKQFSTEGNAIRKRIGVVLQETALYEELTVFENLRFSASLYNVPDVRKRIFETITLLDITERAGSIVHTLSGGLKRRVAIARALLHKPELLIIDEPTIGVDAETRHSIWLHLRFLKSTGTTIVIATNYLDEAQAICDTVAILHKGKLLLSESPEVLIAKTGSCLDIDCELQEQTILTQALAEREEVLRVTQTSTGLSIFLREDAVPDNIVKAVLSVASINAFRVRPPDLSEVFRTLEK